MSPVRGRSVLKCRLRLMDVGRVQEIWLAAGKEHLAAPGAAGSEQRDWSRQYTGVYEKLRPEFAFHTVFCTLGFVSASAHLHMMNPLDNLLLFSHMGILKHYT